MASSIIDLNDPRLTAYILGELHGEELSQFENLLAASADSKEMLEEIRETTECLRVELAAEPALLLSKEQHQRLEEYLNQKHVVGTLNRILPPESDEFSSPCVSAEIVDLQRPVDLRREAIGKRWAVLAAASVTSALGATLLFWPVNDRLPGRESTVKQTVRILAANDPQRRVEFDMDLDGLVDFTNIESNQEQRFREVGQRLDLKSRPELLLKQRNRVEDRRLGRWLSVGNGSDRVSVDFELYRRQVTGSDGEKVSQGSESYSTIVENPFLTPAEQPLSTFSVDVDTASYANVRRFLGQGTLPPADAVRIEELVNYFKYEDPAPVKEQPFTVKGEAAPCPWNRENYVARISLKAREVSRQQRPSTNLVFLLDVSGSMQDSNKLPLVKRAMSLLVEELGERDRVSIVTYAGDAGLKLEPTSGTDQTKIMQAIENLSAGGSTNGAAGIHLAYEQALRHFSKDSANRVILCTDGDFNVGVSSDDELVHLIEQQAKTGVFLSIFGFGMGNLKDSKLEKLADKGNGHYGYIDDLNEARKNFNEELMGTLYTVAKDVKLQVEFNPLTVGAYRLIGYENRIMAAEDFNNDAKDAGEIGAGHTVTALYEIVPRGKWKPANAVDPLKYSNTDATPKPIEQKPNVPTESVDDLFTVKLRYKLPDAAESVRSVDVVVDDIAGKNVKPGRDMIWSTAVASFGMQLRQSKHAGNWTMADVLEAARSAKGDDVSGRRSEFIELVKVAMKLMPTPAK